MRAKKFNKFKKALPGHIINFSIEADSFAADNEWEPPVHRYSAAQILAWILDKTGATLRNHQLVEAWRAIVTKCWNMIDFNTFGENNFQDILKEVQYRNFVMLHTGSVS